VNPIPPSSLARDLFSLQNGNQLGDIILVAKDGKVPAHRGKKKKNLKKYL
jgi:hypothetical protein